MNSRNLSEIQAPIREAFSANPEAAEVDISTTASLSGAYECSVDIQNLRYRAGLPAVVGGFGKTISPGTVFLSSLCTCAGVTLSACAHYMGITIRSGKITAHGKLNLLGTMGMSGEVPMGFSKILLSFSVDTDADPEKLSELLELTRKYSVNCRTVSEGAEMNYEIQRK